jgi:hypothetical protein
MDVADENGRFFEEPVTIIRVGQERQYENEGGVKRG